MAVFWSLTGLLRADNKEWKKGFDAAGQDVDKLDKKSKGFFKDLKASFGKSSTLGQSLKLAAGGGAIAGLTSLGRELNEWVNKIGEVKRAWHEGNASAGDMVETLVGGLPVVGQFWQLGRSIKDVWDGTDDIIADCTKHMKEQVEWAAKFQKIREDTKRSEKDFSDILLHAQEDAVVSQTPEGPERDKMKARVDGYEKIRQLQEKFNKDAEVDRIKSLEQKYVNAHENEDPFGDRHQSKAILQELTPLLQRRDDLLAKFNQTKDLYVKDTQDKIDQIDDDANKKELEKKQALAAKEQELQDKIAEHQQQLADKITEENATPIEKYLEQMKELDQLHKQGLVNDQTFDRAGLANKQALINSSLKQQLEYKPPPLEIKRFGAGTVPEQPKIVEPLNDLVRTADDALAAQRRTADAAEALAKLWNGATGLVASLINF